MNSWLEEIFQPDPPEHFGANTISNTIDHLGAIFGWIDMGTERTLAEGHRDNLCNCRRNGTGLGIKRFERSKSLQCLFRHTLVRSVVIFSRARRVAGEPECAK